MSEAAKWTKLGLCFVPASTSHWMRSHAAVPLAEWLEGDLFKIYFSTRDERNRSFTGYVVIDINRPSQILELSDEPVLSPGALGEFDDSGAMASWLTSFEDQQYLYYIGWNLGVTVPFRNSVGMANRTANGSFVRMFRGPVLDRTRDEPHFCASCCVIPGKERWRMWYLSCTGWRFNNGNPEHAYHIKYAESSNGIDWDRQGDIAIDYAHANEYAISRPSVLYDEGIWKMWYSHRGDTYRIGYAESADGRNWTRLDELSGIDVSASGWDSQMIEYPFVFDHKGRRYMLYNGNDYGRTGFGLAVLEQG
ncbi:hypothetical protein NZ35_12990 [Pseudomonas chlororaphis]|uniref:Glycosyl hydrolase family 32 N-terminal domain-containing protein n=1 Tax=Pseudomonas chlororaphis TaxID=587753 RepID=A0A0A6DED3_9PSED|nr:hypothetical protein NZ35_12990 [Pseudomonas chlororaphis]